MSWESDTFLDIVLGVETNFRNLDVVREENLKNCNELSEALHLLKEKRIEEIQKSMSLKYDIECAQMELKQLAGRRSQMLQVEDDNLKSIYESKKAQLDELGDLFRVLQETEQADAIKDQENNHPAKVYEQIDALKKENEALKMDIAHSRTIFESAKKKLLVTPDENLLSLMRNAKMIRENLVKQKIHLEMKRQYLLNKKADQARELDSLNRTLDSLTNQ